MADIEQARESGGRQTPSSFRGQEQAREEINGKEATCPSTPSHVPERGFLVPALLHSDTLTHGRWDYLTACWLSCEEKGTLPQEPIPQIAFRSVPAPTVWKMLTNALDAVPQHAYGGWSGWSGSTYFRYFLEWLLYGFHHPGQPALPEEPAGCEGASERLLQLLDLALWQQAPYDYFGDLLAQNAYGKRQGFYPTPHTIAELMARMTIEGTAPDTRVLTVCDPCVGTGRLLLHASNYSLRLYGMDIDPLVCQATLVNGYLFAPWLVRPLPHLDAVQYDPTASGAISESMAAQAPPHYEERLADTEHDIEEQWRFEPIKKRRQKGIDDSSEKTPQQGVLF